MSDLSYDFSTVPNKSVDEILRQGQECLAGTIQLAIASDQRATAMAGIFGAGFVALLATSAAIFTGEKYNEALLYSCLITSSGLFFASFICAWAARPIDFFVCGYEPRHLIKSARDLTWLKRYAAEDVHMRIDKNTECLKLAAKWVKIGATTALLSPILGLLIFWINYRPS